MRCVIPQITWNSQQQILSLDFDPTCKAENGFYRMVTVGADTNLLIWHVSQPASLKPAVRCVSELNRHQKAVNVVRFSPDGNWIASGDDDAYIIIWRNDRKEVEEENWTVEKSLRKHLGDVTDLNWSADSNFLLSASIDSTAVLWDVKKGTSKYIWTEHSSYVHGVAFDPAKQLAATISIDRTLRIYDVNTGKLKTKVNKYVNWVEKSEEPEEVVPKLSSTPDESVVGEEGKKAGPPQGNHIFQGDDLATFCRRLCFSPGGEFLIVPAGAVPAEKKLSLLNNTNNNNEGDDDSCSSDPAKKKIRLKPTDKPVVSNNAVILFCRNDFSVPCAIIPTDTSYSVACRFNPMYFKRTDQSFEYSSALTNPVKKDERRIYCTGKLDLSNKENEDVLFESPHRMVYAVATNNSVMIGSTDKLEPLAIVKNIHFARLTDLSWSPDGKVLVTSSTDGYCSLISFDEGELGEVIPLDGILPAEPSQFPVPLKEVKVKEPKQKIASAKKEKTPGAKKTKRDQQNEEGKEKKTPKEKKEKTPKEKKEKTTKTPKSATPKNPDAKPKRRMKLKPIKLMLEAQAALASEKKPVVPESSPITVNNVDRKVPAAYVYLDPLPDDVLAKANVMTLKDEEKETEEEEPENPINGPQFKPQKNTLDAWVVRKASDTSNTATISPKSSKKASETITASTADDSSSSVQFIPMETNAVNEKPMDISSSSKEIEKVKVDQAGTSSGLKRENTSSQPAPKPAKRRVQLITLSTKSSDNEGSNMKES